MFLRRNGPYPEVPLRRGSFRGPNRCRFLIDFASGSLKSSLKALGDHSSCYSELRILIRYRQVRPKFEFASKFGGQARVLTWSFCCTILTVFANGDLKLSLTSLGGLKLSLHSLCLGWRVGIVYTHSFGDRPRGKHNDLTLPYLKLVLIIVILYYITLD